MVGGVQASKCSTSGLPPSKPWLLSLKDVKVLAHVLYEYDQGESENLPPLCTPFVLAISGHIFAERVLIHIMVCLCVQLQALLRAIWTDAVPIFGGVMLLIAVWSLLLSRVRVASSFHATLPYSAMISSHAGYCSELVQCIAWAWLIPS